MLQEAQRQMGQQPDPDLPFDRLLVVAGKVPELERGVRCFRLPWGRSLGCVDERVQPRFVSVYCMRL